MFKLLSDQKNKGFTDLWKYTFFCLHSNIQDQLEVAPLKNLFFLAVLRLEVKDSFGYNKETERMGKTFPTILTYYI